MEPNANTSASVKISGKSKILNAALKIIRTKGYSATSVDDLCIEAGVTKGAFFHYFTSKEDLAIAAAQYWSAVTQEMFEHANYKTLRDPLDRLLGYIAFRKQIVRGQIPEFTCFVGTLVQETFDSNPKIREACAASILGHTLDIEKDIVEAKKKYAPLASWDPQNLALYTQAAIQGAYIVSKAKNDSSATIDCLEHLRNYIESLFKQKN